MQRKISALLAMIILATGSPAVQGAEPAPATKAVSKKSVKRKKLTPQQTYKLQKKAEAEGKRHQLEAQRRQFQQMQEAQQRGLQQQQQH